MPRIAPPSKISPVFIASAPSVALPGAKSGFALLPVRCFYYKIRAPLLSTRGKTFSRQCGKAAVHAGSGEKTKEMQGRCIILIIYEKLNIMNRKNSVLTAIPSKKPSKLGKNGVSFRKFIENEIIIICISDASAL